MLKYIIRLDDATPKMNPLDWKKVETLLDKYDIAPIVGIIPDNKDKLFRWDEDSTFWSNTIPRWKEKNWTFAQHGCHHVYHECSNGIRSEFVDLSYSCQKSLIEKGYNILKERGAIPTCFFAPGHTFDKITVDVCRDSGYFDFISDGYALYPYKERGMLFFPSIFDTAHKPLPVGIYTFILHPSFTTDSELFHLDNFISHNKQFFSSVPDIMTQIDPHRKITLIERGIKPTIYTIRQIRKLIRGIK